MTAREWPASVVDDAGRRYPFTGVAQDGRGMYGGMSGYPFTLADAKRYSAPRPAVAVWPAS